MKLSKLLSKLNEILEERGDLDISVEKYDYEGSYWDDDFTIEVRKSSEYDYDVVFL